MTQTHYWRLRRAQLLARQVEELKAALADHQRATDLLTQLQRSEEEQLAKNQPVGSADQIRLALQHASQQQQLINQFAQRSHLLEQAHHYQTNQLQTQLEQERIRQN